MDFSFGSIEKVKDDWLELRVPDVFTLIRISELVAVVCEKSSILLSFEASEEPLVIGCQSTDEASIIYRYITSIL